MINLTIMTILGACLYRWRGHASKYKKWFPRPFSQIAFALPYAFLVLDSSYFSYFIGLIVFVLTALAVLTGHGNFFLRGSGGDDETTEFIIKWAKPHLPLYWYRALGLAMTGMLVSLPAGIATLNPILAVSGLLKGVAYVISDKLGYGTGGGEWLTGGFLWAVCGYYIGG